MPISMLPSIDEGEQRGVLKVEIQAPGDWEPLVLLATHLDHRPNDRERVASAQAINELAAKIRERPALLAGDLNDTSGSQTLQQLGKVWTSANHQPLATVPVTKPIYQIDFILFRPANRWKAVEVRVLDEAVASDHRPVLAVLELSHEANPPDKTCSFLMPVNFDYLAAGTQRMQATLVKGADVVDAYRDCGMPWP
jgi:endonuclease/exonuclease/phosphatase family metal-dependent hydrolase